MTKRAILSAAVLGACATAEPGLIGGRCLEGDALALVRGFEDTAEVETAVLGREVRAGFRFYEALAVPRGTVLDRREAGDYCTGEKVRYYPPMTPPPGMDLTRSPLFPGNAYVCFDDDDEDGRFERATAHDVTDRRGENAEPERQTVSPPASYAKVGCGDAAG